MDVGTWNIPYKMINENKRKELLSQVMWACKKHAFMVTNNGTMIANNETA